MDVLLIDNDKRRRLKGYLDKAREDFFVVD
jgi:hypothetical protein